MYISYIMRRTQIYLTDEQDELLQRRRKATGATISELIRSAIDVVYLGKRRTSKREMLRILHETAGTWRGRTETGEEYVERLRGTGRLRRLHGL